MSILNHDVLRDAVAGPGVALRLKSRLQPAGGPGTTVYPPTYAADRGARTQYAVEGPRPRDGETTGQASRYARVLLDSVASQANRLELALLEAWRVGDLSFPVAFVDFSDQQGLEDLERVTVLEAPHRIADAIFRDSLLDGTLFRLSDVGEAVTEARPDAATGLFQYCPTALLFGQWDSTGPKGGLGAKFQRALVSEIVGHDVELGVKVGSRIDPLQIEKNAAEILVAQDSDEEWTIFEEEAESKKGKPVLFDRKGRQGDKGRPSMINHGNVTPEVDARAGGVVITHAEQSLVLSLAALRKLRFPISAQGTPLSGGDRATAETAARTAVAALGVAAAALQARDGHDLRSRCLLIPEAPPVLELIRTDGTVEVFDLGVDNASALVRDASTAAADAGVGWHGEELRLVPAPKLVELIRRSRDLATVSADA